MKLRIIAFLAFFLNALLFGSYYSVSKDALGRIDPIVFTFFVMMACIPVALCIIVLYWEDISRDAIKSGMLLGSCLCLGLFTLAVALKYNSATSTAFFPAFNGFLAALCVSLFLRQPIAKATWLAGLISVAGATLLVIDTSIIGIRGALIAFIGGLFCTFYIFLADHEQRGKTAHWPLFGIQLLTMALWASLIALLFGDWGAVQPLPKDIWSILYIAFGTTCLPTLFTVLLQKYISPLTVSFIYILEPVLGALIANIYLHEVLPLNGYFGGSLIIAGALIHTWGSARQPIKRRLAFHRRIAMMGYQLQHSWIGRLVVPAICLSIGTFVLYRLSELCPPAWHTIYSLMPSFFLQIQQGHGMIIALLIAQVLCWIIAWSALVGMGILVVYRVKFLLIAETKVPDATPKMELLRDYDSLEGKVAPEPILRPRMEDTCSAANEGGAACYSDDEAKRCETTGVASPPRTAYAAF